MPLIVLTGIPSSGKSTVSERIRNFFENEKHKTVVIISENNILKSKKLLKSVVYNDSAKEKEIRGILKAELIRAINREHLIILDGLNYIKGFRYEIYCACKSAQTPQCTAYTDMNTEKAWDFNSSNEEPYDKDVFDGLIQRYEPPVYNNRWDSPLFTILSTEVIPLEDIYQSLYERKAEKPNLSTLSQPLSSTNFLYDLDKSTQEVITNIIDAKKINCEGNVKVAGTEEMFLLSSDRIINLPELNRLKRQFLTYIKCQPSLHNKNIKTLFVQYLNTNLS